MATRFVGEPVVGARHLLRSATGTGQPGKFDPATGKFFPRQRPTIGDVTSGSRVRVVNPAGTASVQSGGKRKSASLGMGVSVGGFGTGQGPR